MGAVRGDTGAFYYLVGVEYEMFGVLALFERYVFLFKLRGVALGDISVVGEKHVHPLFLSEDGGSDSALSASEYYQALAVCY